MVYTGTFTLALVSAVAVLNSASAARPGDLLNYVSFWLGREIDADREKCEELLEDAFAYFPETGGVEGAGLRYACGLSFSELITLTNGMSSDNQTEYEMEEYDTPEDEPEVKSVELNLTEHAEFQGMVVSTFGTSAVKAATNECTRTGTERKCKANSKCDWYVKDVCTRRGKKVTCKNIMYGCQEKGFCSFTEGPLQVLKLQCRSSSKECAFNNRQRRCEAKKETTARTSNQSKRDQIWNCNNLCWFRTNNGICDDGGPGSKTQLCPFGFDCADCGTRNPKDKPDPFSG